MNNEAIKFLKSCIDIYSPSGKEEKYSKFLAKFLKEHNFKVNFDNVGNLIAEKGEGKPVILFSSHMDTIPGELPIIEKEGKIYGRGAVDCKSSLAAMVYALSKFDFSKDISGKVIFSGIVREEDSLVGIKEFVKAKIQPDFAIFGEPTKINQICIGYKGRLCIGFRVLSKMGHVASSWEYVNAIEICLEIWNIIKLACWDLTEKHKPTYNKKTKYFDKIIPNLTVIKGGNLTNCVPSECIIQVDIRFPPHIESSQIHNELRTRILEFQNLYETQNQVKIKIQESLSSLVEGFEIKKNESIIGALRWAIYNTVNEKPILIKKTGTTFINNIGIAFGIPSITYGPGDPKLEHTDLEVIEIEEYLNCIEIYKKFLTKFYQIYERKQEKLKS
jgi:LysW-gamma-L-lysine carboxypeptidase